MNIDGIIHIASIIMQNLNNNDQHRDEQKEPGMTTDQKKKKKTIAIIGGGVTGLAACWHFKESCGNDNNDYEIHLYESENRLGGHAWTVPVPIHDNENGNNDNNDVNIDSNGDATASNSSSNNNTINVDIGFMVFNNENYPNMIRWFERLFQKEQLKNDNNNTTKTFDENSDMSLSVYLKDDDTKRTIIEWSSQGFNSLFSNRIQLIQPSFYLMIYDMIRFHYHSTQLLSLHNDDPRKYITIQQYLYQNKYSQSFILYYLYPMIAALWSSSLDDVQNFPAIQLISFLNNHQMLQLLNRPQWKTVSNRSIQYTSRMKDLLSNNADTSTTQSFIHTNSIVHSIVQNNNGQYNIVIYDYNDCTKTIKSNELFDDIIFTCHPPTTVEILQNSIFLDNNNNNNNNNNTTTRYNVNEYYIPLLSQIQYSNNVIYVHSDISLMPSYKRTWSSWNCIGSYNQLMNMTNTQSNKNNSDNDNGSSSSGSGGFEGSESGFGQKLIPNNLNSDKNGDDTLEGENGRMKAVYVTYWLNRLQNLKTNHNIFVSLNPHTIPNVYHHRVIMAHPQFNTKSLHAREVLQQKQIQYSNIDGLWFGGAWTGYGFHEDGCRSGFDIATKISNIPVPWIVEEEKVDTNNNNNNNKMMVLPPPDLSASMNHSNSFSIGTLIYSTYQKITYDIPVYVCKRFIYYFLNHAIQKGSLQLKYNDGTIDTFGDTTPCSLSDNHPVTIRVFEPWFFVKTAFQYDLGLARSYMSGYFVIEPLHNMNDYNPILRPLNTKNETTKVLGDPIGLTRLFLLFIGNRDYPHNNMHYPKKSARGTRYSNAFSNASGLLLGQIGSFMSYIWYKLTMDNSERGGSLKNIHSHYDLSNDLFRTFLDKETLMYSSAIYDTIPSPIPKAGLMFRGSLEEAQWRKLDTLCSRAQIQPGQVLLDIGFGWGGLSIYAAKKYGCQVTGITLSVEQKALAEERVRQENLTSLITFEVIDYRTFARQIKNHGKYDRVISCEMIEAVGHDHLGEFFWVVEQVLKHDGILVMEAITTPEVRYENYIRSTDFINTIIFPGSCCPSLHALMDAAYKNSSLTLEHIDNIGLHYAETLAEWRRRFNASEDAIRSMKFDDIFIRAWNYYLTYCEAGFFSQTENCLILVFSRQGCRSLIPLCTTNSVTQQQNATLSITETSNWLTDSLV